MKSIINILLLLSSVTFGGKRKRPSQWQSSSSTSSTTPSPTPSDEELCGCYNIDLVCSPTTNTDGEICYYYLIEKVSDDDYCKPIEYISLGTGDLDECGLQSTDIQSLLTDYAPKCYDIDPLYDGTCNNGQTGVPGIKVKMGPPPPKSGSGSGSGSTGASYPSGSGSSPPPPQDVADYMVFSMCFDSSQVSGFQESGQIGFKTGGGRYTCDAGNVLPNFCATPVTPAPVTPAPVTPAPITPAPITPAPVTPAPVTPAPVTPAPITPAPITPAPITPAPIAPVTAAPVTPAPVTPAPVTPAPITPAPITPAPITPQPTANPTTAAPSIAPTYVACDSTDAMNVVFLMDESGSVDSTEWDVILGFVKRIVTFDVSPESYVALYEYAALAAFQELLEFTGPMSTEQSVVINELDSNNYTPAGQTETWDAVNRVLDDIHLYKTNDNCNGNGDECWNRNDILFLITDGEPTGTDVCGDMATRMAQSDVDIVIVLIDPNGDIDETKVSCLDVVDGGLDVIRLDSFEGDAFTEIEGRIRSKICDDDNPISTGPQPEFNPWQYCDDEGNCSIGLGPIPTQGGGGQGGAADP